jgi:MFS family permease
MSSPADDRPTETLFTATESRREPTTVPTRRERRKAVEGGTKWGAAFFGWLTAVGTGALLTGIIAALTTGSGITAEEAADGVAATTGAVMPGGVLGAVLVAAVLFVAYYAGGYVAGRMARFQGARQGVAVWVWAVVVAVVVALLIAFGGRRVDLAPVAVLLGLPGDPAGLTLGGIIAVAVALLVGLVGAVLGGLAGMAFHRRIDRRIDRAEPLPDGTTPA